MSLDAETIIRTLGLSPHPEGGYYAETFRAPSVVKTSQLEGTRNASTAIYFLLRDSDFSAFHCVLSDEVWNYYAGDPLALYLLDPQGNLRRNVLGIDFAKGERPQCVAQAGVLQGARIEAPKLGFTLLGCTVSPGFEFGDFSMPLRGELHHRFPQHTAIIDALTRA